jgi:exosortase/archaeosortase family protein
MLRTKIQRTLAIAAAPLLAVLAGLSAIAALPSLEISLFAQGAARIAAFITGSPVVRIEAGWLLPMMPQDVVVSEACSATGFFLTVAALIAWQLARRGLGAVSAPALGLAASLPVVLVVNALRVITVAQVHRWIIPALPENWSAFAHMTTGVALFLPALIGLNLVLELHARHRPDPET